MTMMLSAIRRRLTFANVAVTLALVCAMSGGAYAASRYVITSTKQIKPSVLKQLQGKAGVAGAQGVVGPQGPAGSQGPAGPQGAVGATGKEGPPGKNGENGKEGKTGYAEMLPSGKTLTGQYSAASYSKGALGGAAETAVTFPFRVENDQGEGPLISYVKRGASLPEGCTGSFEHPGAKPDHLCIFETTAQNITTSFEGYPLICNYAIQGSCPENREITNVNPSGFGLVALAEAEGTVAMQGTWAVTAE
jgi:Collagen triple helix repeat (20 copies)